VELYELKKQFILRYATEGVCVNTGMTQKFFVRSVNLEISKEKFDENIDGVDVGNFSLPIIIG
jgi:hypothetical protein